MTGFVSVFVTGFVTGFATGFVPGLATGFVAGFVTGFATGFASRSTEEEYHSNTVHSQSPNNGLLKYNGGIYPPRQSVFPSES